MSHSKSWHALSSEQVLSTMKSTMAGLSTEEALQRRAQFGVNRLPEPPRPSQIKRFLLQFHNILIYVLLAVALITTLLEHWTETAVILAVVVLNALIGFIQEGKAEKAMQAIRAMLAPHAAVLRDGQRQSVAGEQLVPGDIVLLEAGDKVPADVRFLEVHGLQIQEAVLTGESVPVDKQTLPVAADAVLGDCSCLGFSGTTVTAGQGQGVVVATGAATEIGRISGMLAEVELLTTPLVAQMAVFARWLTFFILAVAVLILVFGHFVLHYEFTELLIAVVGLSVAAIPEGLPAVLTITLAVGVQAMARRNAIVRRLPAIETLGSVSVICTDKTGTLTRNEMSVATVVMQGMQFQVESDGYAPTGKISQDGVAVAVNDYPPLMELCHVAALCNDAQLKQEAEMWRVEGDPMEGALLAFSGKVCVSGLPTQWHRTDLIPFDAKHKFMATLHHPQAHPQSSQQPSGQQPSVQHAAIFVKGAPEAVLALCTSQRQDQSGTAPLDQAYWCEQIEQVAAQGQRVLAIAVRQVGPGQATLQHSDINGQLIFLGLVGLIDPPRAEAIEAVADCHRAGIRVKMITGDHAITAAAIAHQIGLQNASAVLTGVDLDHLDDVALAAAVLQTDVFARTNPEHKLRLVTALQAHGMTVAMTGDGVNDAPALKRADAGIAMGQKGSEVAKEAADLVLADDNFTSIAAAVREGRTVYDNIKKVISWTLPTSTGEASVIILALLFGMTLPITPIQLLWVNMATAVTLGIALAFEPTEENTMRRPPRPRSQPLLNGALVWHICFVTLLIIAGVFGVYRYAIDQNYSVNLARSMAMNMLVVMEIFHLFFIRNIYGTALTWKAIRGTKAVWIAVILVTFGQFVITYLPLMQRVFLTESIALFDGVLIILIGAGFFAIIEIEKQIRLRLPKSPGAGGGHSMASHR